MQNIKKRLAEKCLGLTEEIFGNTIVRADHHATDGTDSIQVARVEIALRIASSEDVDSMNASRTCGTAPWYGISNSYVGRISSSMKSSG